VPSHTCHMNLMIIPTIEGVWLSVTPTKDYLVVALDFEGLNPISCSHQS